MSNVHVTHVSSAGLGSPAAQRALLSLHRTLEFRELWAALQRVFEITVPHDTLVMSVNYTDWRKETTTLRLTSAHSRVVHDKAGEQLVAKEGRNFFQPFLEAHPGIPVYHHTQVMADAARIPQTRYYRRYMLPLGWRYSAHVLFWREGNVETAFALRRRADQGDFTSEELDLLRALHAQIGAAFERVRAFEHERRRRRLLENFYRAKPEAVIFLDWDLSLLYASQEAIAACAVWNFGPAQARAYTPQAVFALPPAMVAACGDMKPRWQAAAAPGRDPAPLTEMLASGWPDYDATITLRNDGNGALSSPIFILRLRGPAPEALLGAPASHEPAQNRLLGLLTPTERELAQLVCGGLSNKEVAERLNRTEGSVKVQLSGVFQKLRVRSRAQLMVALR